MVDTVKFIDSAFLNHGEFVKDLDRSKLRSVQTPQIFEFNLIYRATKIFESNIR